MATSRTVETAIRSEIRSVWSQLRSVQIRQTARKAFDLVHLGTGAAERILASLILGGVFLGGTLIVAHVIDAPSNYAVGVALIGLVSVVVTSAVLILWKSDQDLQAQLPQLKERLAKLQEREAEARAVREAEEQERKADEAVSAALAPVPNASPRGGAPPIHVARTEGPPPVKPLKIKACPFCQNQIQARAIKCQHCGEILDRRLRKERRPQHWNPGVAAVLSLFWPGLGQIYKLQIINGIFWMILVVVGYICCFVPGFILHVLCIFGAASGGKE